MTPDFNEIKVALDMVEKVKAHDKPEFAFDMKGTSKAGVRRIAAIVDAVGERHGISAEAQKHTIVGRKSDDQKPTSH